MTTVQIIGVAVAGAAVLLLVIALLVARRRRDEEETRVGASFLDGAPQDTFSGLGKAERPVEDITLDPALDRAAAARAAEAHPAEEHPPEARAPEQRQPPPGGLGLDWGPDLSVRELAPEPPAAPVWGGGQLTAAYTPPDESETTVELRPLDDETTGELRPRDAAALTDDEAPPVPEGESDGRESRLVPLSDIIVTTSGKMVDLEDPEVRRMLTELVTFEIDQAADFRRQGQAIDAVLQLTEAEKVSRALGMAESAARIRAMMEDIRRSE